MPRTARIDAPGSLYHVFARGIERRNIFVDDKDRYFFLKCLGRIIVETGTPIYSFALLPNHFHLLLRRGKVPIPTTMRRLLTSYAVYFNKRHSRVGHLFQNRYKGFVCQDEKYFRELIRYIHLNPVRSGQLRLGEELDSYPFTAHSYVIGRREHPWFNPVDVLGKFGDCEESAVAAYLEFMGSLAADGLSSGGRLMGITGAAPEKKSPRLGTFSDAAKAPRWGGIEQSTPEALDIASKIESICRKHRTSMSEVLGGVRRKPAVEARAELVIELSRTGGLNNSAIARELGLSQSGVSMILKRMAGADG